MRTVTSTTDRAVRTLGAAVVIWTWAGEASGLIDSADSAEADSVEDRRPLTGLQLSGTTAAVAPLVTTPEVRVSVIDLPETTGHLADSSAGLREATSSPEDSAPAIKETARATDIIREEAGAPWEGATTAIMAG